MYYVMICFGRQIRADTEPLYLRLLPFHGRFIFSWVCVIKSHVQEAGGDWGKKESGRVNT